MEIANHGLFKNNHKILYIHLFIESYIICYRNWLFNHNLIHNYELIVNFYYLYGQYMNKSYLIIHLINNIRVYVLKYMSSMEWGIIT